MYVYIYMYMCVYIYIKYIYIYIRVLRVCKCSCAILCIKCTISSPICSSSLVLTINNSVIYMAKSNGDVLLFCLILPYQVVLIIKLICISSK